MERTTWTDERLDDAMTRFDARFDRLERRIDHEFADLRNELRTGFAELRRDMHQVGLAIGVGYLGLAAAVIAAVT